MKKRYLYSLLFGIPGFLVAAMSSLAIFAAVAGVLWIYVFGDDPWPFLVEGVSGLLFVITFLIFWAVAIAAGYFTGKNLEKVSALNRKHVLASTLLTLVFVIFIVLQQLSLGNIGPKSDTSLCGDFCGQQGYAGSGVPSQDSGLRRCSCFDSSGHEALTVPLDRIDPEVSK